MTFLCKKSLNSAISANLRYLYTAKYQSDVIWGSFFDKKLPVDNLMQYQIIVTFASKLQCPHYKMSQKIRTCLSTSPASKVHRYRYRLSRCRHVARATQREHVPPPTWTKNLIDVESDDTSLKVGDMVDIVGESSTGLFAVLWHFRHSFRSYTHFIVCFAWLCPQRSGFRNHFTFLLIPYFIILSFLIRNWRRNYSLKLRRNKPRTFFSKNKTRWIWFLFRYSHWE